MRQALYRKDPFVRSVEILEGIIKVTGYLSALLLIILAFFVCYNAAMRYFINFSSIALQEAEWHLFAVSFLLAIPYTLQMNKHIRLDIFYQYYRSVLRHYLWIIVNLFFIIPLSLIILHYGSDFAMLSYQQNEISESGGLTHRYIIKAMPVFAFSLMFMQSYAEILKSIIWLRKYYRIRK